MKKTTAVVIIVLCFVATALIVVRNLSHRSAGIESIQAGAQVWMQCSAPDCGAVYQIGRKDYFRQVDGTKRRNPRLENLPTAPPITCQKCGKATAMRAVKCEKCGHLFLYSSRKGKEFDYADRCPKCGYSRMEQDRTTNR